MLTIIGLCLWVSGIVIGFCWGCRTGIDRPAVAQGFLAGFGAPFVILASAFRNPRARR